MNLLKSITGLFRQTTIGNERFWELRNELDRLQQAEERTVQLAGTPFGTPYAELFDEVLSLRERRVDVLRELGWNAEADKQAADNEMRRGWSAPDSFIA